jgi:hypothetical protein
MKDRSDHRTTPGTSPFVARIARMISAKFASRLKIDKETAAFAKSDGQARDQKNPAMV